MTIELLKDGWDIHVHASPSLFERWGDAWDLISAYSEAGMKGCVLKAHHGSSVEAASLISSKSSDVEVYGGLVLNEYSGGLSPIAVEAALVLGAKIIWLPTVHAAYHGERFGKLGGFSFQGTKIANEVSEGNSILDDAGEVKAEVKEIVSLVAQHGAVLGSGHISPQEIVALVNFVKANNSTRILLNHVFLKTPGLKAADLNELAANNVWFEAVQFTVSSLGDRERVKEVASTMQLISSGQWIIASDSGQKSNLPAPQALEEYLGLLIEEGMSAEVLRPMIRGNVENLLFS